MKVAPARVHEPDLIARGAEVCQALLNLDRSDVLRALLVMGERDLRALSVVLMSAAHPQMKSVLRTLKVTLPTLSRPAGDDAGRP